MRRMVTILVVAVSLASPAMAGAQGGDGSLRGAVKDDQGGALPGVTVTATSPALLSPSLAISDAGGNYRLVNLPPGTYTLTAELAGFAVFRREGILLRAGANFQVDITMALGTLEETITVSGDSPMIEVSSPSNVLNIHADFQKTLPTVGIKLSKRFRPGEARDIEIAGNILNLLNGGRGTECARGGANRQYNTVAFLQPGNLQAARSVQLDLLFRF